MHSTLLAMNQNATKEETCRFHRRMKRKANHILALEARVLKKREEVHATARRKAKEKQDFLSGNFVQTWKTGFKALKDSEAENRMSDKQDNEVWRMTEIRRWFDSHSSPQAVEGFDPLASGYTTSGDKNETLPALMRTHRIPTPEWAAAEDLKVFKESEARRVLATRLNALQDSHFADFEGNLGIQRARTAVLASHLNPPKGWGSGHTHVSGFRSPPWKERPPQEAPRYKCPELLRQRDLFIQAGGGLESTNAKREETRRRATAMKAGSGIFGGG